MSPLLTSSVDLEPVEQVRTLLVDRIEKGELRLPLLPQVAHQVMTLTNDPDSDATRLASLIQQDQALAGHILRSLSLQKPLDTRAWRIQFKTKKALPEESGRV